MSAHVVGDRYIETVGETSADRQAAERQADLLLDNRPGARTHQAVYVRPGSDEYERVLASKEFLRVVDYQD